MSQLVETVFWSFWFCDTLCLAVLQHYHSKITTSLQMAISWAVFFDKIHLISVSSVVSGGICWLYSVTKGCWYKNASSSLMVLCLPVFSFRYNIRLNLMFSLCVVRLKFHLSVLEAWNKSIELSYRAGGMLLWIRLLEIDCCG